MHVSFGRPQESVRPVNIHGHRPTRETLRDMRTYASGTQVRRSDSTGAGSKTADPERSKDPEIPGSNPETPMIRNGLVVQ